MTIQEIEGEILKLGKNLLDCNHACKGADILCNKKTGHIPRCLFFERKGRNPGSLGMVIVGTNPGQASDEELRDYISWHESGNLTYEKVVLRVIQGGYDRVGQYYGPIRKFLNACNLDGPILWTEAVHCQNAIKGDGLSDKTIYSCSSRYLAKQLEQIPKDWLIIAGSAVAFKALKPLCRDRRLFGFNHPGRPERGKKVHTVATQDPNYFISILKNLQPGKPYYWKFQDYNNTVHY
jgi:hypothetical protein